MESRLLRLKFVAIGIAIFLTGSVSCAVAAAQDKEVQQVEFPADPSLWLNSPPISSEILKGKAAVLYFFEEG